MGMNDFFYWDAEIYLGSFLKFKDKYFSIIITEVSIYI